MNPPDRSRIFVFGSNLAGRHGKGAARYARLHHGAIPGQGIGLQGTSYAIPTKDAYLNVLPLEEIEKHVGVFLQFAQNRTDLQFNVTRIGCGLAGYVPEQIAPFFRAYPFNCFLDVEFLQVIQNLN